MQLTLTPTLTINYSLPHHYTKTKLMKNSVFFTALVLMSIDTTALAACQPQCVAHVRYSSSIFTHRVGAARGAYDWFNLAKQHGHTTSHPGVGKVKLPLAFAPQPGLNPRFGHVVFVKNSEEIIQDKKYLLNISQTNYAGRCRREFARAYFYPDTMRVEFIDGYFKEKTFEAAGFIIQ